ncbi:MAG TPA: alginate lyase family protein [Chloroflexota bacterium]|nr:alginate lyase family protein [Chloroflexota bacterium]
MAEEHTASWADWALLPGVPVLDGTAVQHEVLRAHSISAGQFQFVNRTVELGQHPAWRNHGQSQLWSYHLHYFDYLLSLGLWWQAEQATDALESAARLIAHWIESNPPAQGDGWHPYTVAARLSNWLQGSELFGMSLRQHPLLEPLLLRSITEQVLFLEQNLEFDVLGNHLLKNLRALVHCGLALAHPDAKRWLHQGALWTFEQAEHQILPDGGHYERSPMYQLQVFWDLLDILSQLQRAGVSIPRGVSDRFASMLHWIAAMRHPDGNIPLLNDAVLGVTGSPQEALAAGAAFFGEAHAPLNWRATALLGELPLPRAELPLPLGEGWGEGTEESPQVSAHSAGDVALPDSGYFLFSGPSAWLVADAGDPCPDELPAHAHADALSFELSVGGQRMIVDAGVFEYQAGTWRDFMRGTAAHNTLIVDGQDQSEVWGSFRVGRRARVKARYWAERDGVRVLEAEHDGYEATLGVRHHRWIARVDQRFFVVSDLLEGSGQHEARSFIHLHPDARVGDASLSEDARLIGAALGEAGLVIAPFGFDELDHYVGCLSSPRAWYSEELGRRLPSTEISLVLHGGVPRISGYLLLLDTPTSLAITSDSATRLCLELAFSDAAFDIHTNAAGVRVERR